MLTSELSGGTSATLHLRTRGPVLLYSPAGRLQLRRKALAILYYLAFEGPTRRERLADLLWDSPDPLANLRVELNAINRVLKDFDIVFCDRYQDPLELPREIHLDFTRPGHEDEILDGLDGLGEGFQEWLDWRRTRLRASRPAEFDFDAELDSLTGSLRAPHLLVIEPQPCETALPFAEALSQRLRMPLLPLAATGKGLRYAAPPHPAGLIERIQAERGSIWLFERPFFGDDPSQLLELRSRLHSSEISYLKLPGNSWFRERKRRLGQYDFGTAARLYLSATGHPGYLAELLAFAEAEQLPLLQKYRAAIELEVRKLSPACRTALVGLAIRARSSTETSSAFPETMDCLAELVEQRWLEYADSGWRFTSSFARNILLRSMQEGLRQAGHRQQAVTLEQLGRPVPALIQHLMAGDEVEGSEFEGRLSSWAYEFMGRRLGLPSRLQRVAPQPVKASRRESYIEADKTYGDGVEREGNTAAFVRHGQKHGPSGVALTLPAKPVLLQISGEARIENNQGIGLFGDAVPLRLMLDDKVVATMAPDQPAGQVDGELLLPLPGKFNYWFLSSGSRQLAVESACETGIVQFDVRCFEQSDAGTSVEAWALKA